jgi:hypothetical protein
MKLDVGKSYKNRLGHKKDIVERFCSLKGESCYRDHEGRIYGEDGHINSLRNDPEDLVFLILEGKVSVT